LGAAGAGEIPLRSALVALKNSRNTFLFTTESLSILSNKLNVYIRLPCDKYTLLLVKSQIIFFGLLDRFSTEIYFSNIPIYTRTKKKVKKNLTNGESSSILNK